MKIGLRILSGFAVGLAAVALAGGVGIYSLGSLGAEVAHINDAVMPKIAVVTDVERNALETGLYTQMFLTKRDEATKELMLDRLNKVYVALDKVKEVTSRFSDTKTFQAAEKAIADTKTYDQLTQKGLELIKKNDDLTKAFGEKGAAVTKLAQDYASSVHTLLDTAIAAGDATHTTRLAKDLTDVTQIERLALNTRIAEHAYMLWQRDGDWQILKGNVDDILKLLNTMEEAQTDKEQVTRIRAARQATKDYLAATTSWVDNNNALKTGLSDMEKAERAVSGAARVAAGLASDEGKQSSLSATETGAMGRTIILFVAGLSVLLLVGTGIVVNRSITPPVVSLTAVMKKLSSGDLSVDVTGAGRADEIGEMSRAVEVFKANMLETERLRTEQETSKQRAEQDRQALMRQLANDFESAVGGIVKTVSSAAGQLQTAAGTMSSAAADANTRSNSAASASEAAAGNVQSVASATEQLSGSISEIGQQVNEAARIASRAATDANLTADKVQALTEASTRIGDIVGIISSIAGQTNLLALNATIEAARAGEAGRGFAVVASEVKNLAEQTAKATQDIASQITSIQNSTTESSAAISSITEVIQQLNGISGTIAAAVEEQAATTQEIARSVQMASMGTQEVTSSIGGVTNAASSASTAAAQVLGSSTDLSRQADLLQGEVTKFLATVRAA